MVLSPSSGGNELRSYPFRLANARCFDCRHDFSVFIRRDSCGDKFAALFPLWKRRPSNWIRLAHGFFLGGGVLSKAVKTSLNVTPLRFGIITSSGFFLCFCRFDFATISLSAPRNTRDFCFHQAIFKVINLVPSNHLPIS